MKMGGRVRVRVWVRVRVRVVGVRFWCKVKAIIRVTVQGL